MEDLNNGAEGSYNNFNNNNNKDNNNTKNNTSSNSIKATSLQLVPTEMDPFSRRMFAREILKNMPKNVQNRVTFLKNLQMDYHKTQMEFYRDVFELEKMYHAKMKNLYDQREKIVSGEIDPPEEQPKWKPDAEKFDSELSTVDFSAYLKDVQDIPQDIKGVPDFWVRIFRNCNTLSQIIYDHDVPALKALKDIKMYYGDESSYILQFYFNKNSFFNNEVLTKQYFLKNTVCDVYPFGFEGLEIYKCKGCIIDWKEKMNLNLRIVRKREKHKETGAIRTTIRYTPRDTFFKFFSPPEVDAEEVDSIDEGIQDILRIDFEIGHFLRAEVIPKAVLYYAGDAVDDEEDEESFESDDDSTGGGDLDESEINVKRVPEMLNVPLRN